MFSYSLQLANGDTIVVNVREAIDIDTIYEHLVRTEVYNILTSNNNTSTIPAGVLNSFLIELRRR